MVTFTLFVSNRASRLAFKCPSVQIRTRIG
jgi:hypothetical protein